MFWDFFGCLLICRDRARKVVNKRGQRERNERVPKRGDSNRKKLQDVRVIQRNLVYITNISLSMATDEVYSIVCIYFRIYLVLSYLAVLERLKRL